MGYLVNFQFNNAYTREIVYNLIYTFYYLIYLFYYLICKNYLNNRL